MGSLWCSYELLGSLVYTWTVLSGNSMHPSIPSGESWALVNPRYHYGRNCKVGDIIQFKHPYFPTGSAAKRILGMPGDYVVFDAHEAVGVGGAKGPWMGQEELDEERQEPQMIQVPEGHVWVVGDNLAFSRDSRFFGPLPMGLILGKMEYNVPTWSDWRSFRGDQMVTVPTEEVD